MARSRANCNWDRGARCSYARERQKGDDFDECVQSYHEAAFSELKTLHLLAPLNAIVRLESLLSFTVRFFLAQRYELLSLKNRPEWLLVPSP